METVDFFLTPGYDINSFHVSLLKNGSGAIVQPVATFYIVRFILLFFLSSFSTVSPKACATLRLPTLTVKPTLNYDR